MRSRRPRFSVALLFVALALPSVAIAPSRVSARVVEDGRPVEGAVGSAHVLTTMFSTAQADPPAVQQERAPGWSARIQGRVLNRDGRALESAEIAIEGLDLNAIANVAGRFSIWSIPPGRHVIRTSLLGYATRRDTLDLDEGAIVDVEVRLAVRPVDLPPISVEARSRWLATQGFYDRRDGGLSGHIITRADIERQKPTELHNLLDDVPGVRLYRLGVGKHSIRFNRYATLSTGDPLDGCEPLIWLDGQRYIEKLSIRRTHGDISHVENINFISPDVIEAIEIYVGNPPIRFNHACGVVLIWTRRGG